MTPVFKAILGGGNVRFGSKADICSARADVRFTPNSDRKSGFPHKVMSALPPKADMCSAVPHVRFGPKADIAMAIFEEPCAHCPRDRPFAVSRPEFF
jgi:hypothetical protein